MLKSIIKTQSIVRVVGSLADLISFPFDTPSDYKTLRGFYIIKNSGTATEIIKIALKDPNGVAVLQSVNIVHLTVGNGGNVPIDSKFYRKTPIDITGGKKIKIELQNFVTVAGVNQDYDFVYECDNDPI